MVHEHVLVLPLNYNVNRACFKQQHYGTLICTIFNSCCCRRHPRVFLVDTVELSCPSLEQCTQQSLFWLLWEDNLQLFTPIAQWVLNNFSTGSNHFNKNTNQHDATHMKYHRLKGVNVLKNLFEGSVVARETLLTNDDANSVLRLST